MTPFESTPLTWAALLSHWMDFARSSVALPRDAQGRAWRASIAAIVRLQAVTFALGEIDRLTSDEQQLALDKAELLLAQSDRELNAAWADEEPPESVREVQRDAAVALSAARRVAAPADHSNNGT